MALFLLWASGCATPPYTHRLDRLLVENGNDEATEYAFRCTAGAHRGASNTYTENTLAALQAADHDPKYAFIEFDVQYSRDHKMVVFHDKRMLRLFGSLKTIGNTDFDELEKLSEGEIAAYDTVMDGLTKRLNIEIKAQGDPEEDERLVDEIVADLHKRKRIHDVLISSISDDVITYVSEQYPDIPTGKVIWLTSSTYLPFDRLTRKLYDQMNNTGADYLLLHVANLRNIHDLLTYKPSHKTVIFWAFDDSIYIVHKDHSDRLWGRSSTSEMLRTLQYKLRRDRAMVPTTE